MGENMSTFWNVDRLRQEKCKNSFQFSKSFFGIAKTCRSTRSARITTTAPRKSRRTATGTIERSLGVS